VGVVGDVRHEGLQSEPIGQVFYPIREPDGDGGFGANLALVIRSDAPPESLADPARETVWSIDPNVPITHRPPREARRGPKPRGAATC
jgi:hypothetical protein